MTEVKSPFGNSVRVCDIERTLRDIVKGNNSCDIRLVNQAMKAYAVSKEKAIAKNGLDSNAGEEAGNGVCQ